MPNDLVKHSAAQDEMRIEYLQPILAMRVTPQKPDPQIACKPAVRLDLTDQRQMEQNTITFASRRLEAAKWTQERQVIPFTFERVSGPQGLQRG
jgi:hypothetical protein